MKSNYFSIAGKLNFIEIKYTNAGMAITTLLIGKKKYNSDEYESYKVSAFKELAEEVSAKFKKGDYIGISGTLRISEYKNKDGVDVKELKLIATSVDKVTYNKELKEYVTQNEMIDTKQEDLSF